MKKKLTFFLFKKDALQKCVLLTIGTYPFPFLGFFLPNDILLFLYPKCINFSSN